MGVTILKTFIMLQKKNLFQINTVLLNFLLIKEFWEKQHTVTVYNIDKKYFLSSKSALE